MHDPARCRRAEEIFQLAADLAGSAREALLGRECAGDPALRTEVESLLRHLESGDEGFLERPAMSGASVPARLGRYRLLRQIGEGGMATVYEAEQENPRRRVALKLIRTGTLDRERLRRFELEAAVLGHLRHPGIAAIYEAGTFAGEHGGPARPYFAMEFVAGVPLDQHARDRGLGLRERLELVAELCDAVHHAHQKGVIHRDLKPANILVDDSGRPKILDFGVARATHADLCAATMHTEAGQVVGTLAYMSPEQIGGRPEELDIRSDVYALGVILYQLLAGRLPFEVSGRSIAEVGRVIREDEPWRLSEVSTLYRGDVETIVGKALAKEKERRYQSAAELGADIRRHLHDEPIAARPASAIYQLRKFARRNRGLVGGVAAALVALVAALVAVSAAAVRARADRDRAEESARLLEAVLLPADPFPTTTVLPEHYGAGAKYVDVLDQSVARLAREPIKDPLFHAQIRQAMAVSYFGRGRFKEGKADAELAIRLLSGRVSRTDRRLLSAKLALAYNQTFLGELSEAERIATAAVEDCTAAYGPDELTLRAMNCLWLVYLKRGYFEDAAALCRRMLAILDSSPRPLEYARYSVKGQLAFLYVGPLGRPIEGERLANEALAEGQALHGDRGSAVGYTYMALAGAAQRRGDYRSAEELWERGMAIWLAVTGDSFRPEFEPWLGRMISHQAGARDVGLAVMFRALDQARATFGDDGAITASAAGELAMRLAMPDCPQELAVAMFGEYFRIVKCLEPMQAHAYMHAQLAELYLALDRPAEAETEFRTALRIAETFTRDEWMRHIADDREWLVRLAQLLIESDRAGEAMELYGRLDSLLIERSDPFSQKRIAQRLMGTAGQFGAAEVLARQAVDGFRRHPEPPTEQLIDALDTWAEALRGLGRLREAESAWDEAFGLWRTLAPEVRSRWHFPSRYGEFLLERQEFKKSEGVLLAVREALRETGGSASELAEAEAALKALRETAGKAPQGAAGR